MTAQFECGYVKSEISTQPVWFCSRFFAMRRRFAFKLRQTGCVQLLVIVAGYTKLFSSIIASTIWREDDTTRIVWITMLAMADRLGLVEASVPGLADMARVSIEECRAALSKFLSPDVESRCKENEGRRIKEIAGGWAVLNYSTYRKKMTDEDKSDYAVEYRNRKKTERRRNLTAERVRRFRERKRMLYQRRRKKVTVGNETKRSVTQCNDSNAYLPRKFVRQAEAEAEAVPLIPSNGEREGTKTQKLKTRVGKLYKLDPAAIWDNDTEHALFALAQTDYENGLKQIEAAWNDRDDLYFSKGPGAFCKNFTENVAKAASRKEKKLW